MSATSQLAKTPLYDWHVARGARMVEFSGWRMPVQYGSIVTEHLATRRAAGLFDISHMGRVLVDGPDATPLLERVLTRRAADMNPGQVRYSLICNAAGGVLDDVLVYQVELPDGDLSGFGLVVNAGNRQKIIAWLQQQAQDLNVQIRDHTHEYAMIAIQGPRAIELLDGLADIELTALRYYYGAIARVASYRSFVSRTGYTGEDGCEIICDANDVVDIWTQLIERVEAAGGSPVGLAARDTLRLEAGMPLYGHELSEQVNPCQAGLDFAVNLRGREFVGRDAIARFQQDPDQTVRIGLQIDGRRAAREGSRILLPTDSRSSPEGGQQVVGEVTSGTFSPTFERPIAMGYVKPTLSAPGTSLEVEIRGETYTAQVVPLPFYQRGN